MKKLITICILMMIASLVHAQPCKQVRKGMTKAQVLKEVGKPASIDSVGHFAYIGDKKVTIVIWQYDDPAGGGNQRIEFKGNNVFGVIADGKKYDELIEAVKKGDVPGSELGKRIEKINREGCK